MTRIFFIMGIWLAGLISGHIAGDGRSAFVRPGVQRLISQEDSVMIRAGPMHQTAVNPFPFDFFNPPGKTIFLIYRINHLPYFVNL